MAPCEVLSQTLWGRAAEQGQTQTKLLFSPECFWAGVLTTILDCLLEGVFYCLARAARKRTDPDLVKEDRERP